MNAQIVAVHRLPMSAALTLLTLSIVGVANSQAAVTAFNNRPNWLTAATPISFTENFQFFSVDTPFRNNVFVALAGGMTLVEIGPASQSDGNFIDVPPFAATESVNGTTNAVITVDNTGSSATDTRVDLLFSTPVKAWGADFANAAGGDIAAVDVISTSNALLGTISVTQNFQFLGFTTTAGEQVGKLRFYGLTQGGSTREYFQIDEVAGSYVPEPASAGLGLIAAAVVCVEARRRRRAL
jgi:hypothetical protein